MKSGNSVSKYGSAPIPGTFRSASVASTRCLIRRMAAWSSPSVSGASSVKLRTRGAVKAGSTSIRDNMSSTSMRCDRSLVSGAALKDLAPASSAGGGMPPIAKPRRPSALISRSTSSTLSGSYSANARFVAAPMKSRSAAPAAKDLARGRRRALSRTATTSLDGIASAMEIEPFTAFSPDCSIADRNSARNVASTSRLTSPAATKRLKSFSASER